MASHDELVREVDMLLAPLHTTDMAAPYEELLREADDSFCVDGAVDWNRVLTLVSG